MSAVAPLPATPAPPGTPPAGRPGEPAGPRIVVVGSANIDLVATAPRLPAPGETVLGHQFTQVPGGKGANQAIAATRAGGRTTLLAALGSDGFGVTVRARLSASGVDTSALRVAYGASGVAVIVVDDAGENSIVVVPGANATLVGFTEAELAVVTGADVLVCQLEVPLETVRVAVAAARAAGVPVILNAAPARSLPADLLAAVDLLVVNELEAAALAGLPRPGPAAPSGPAATSNLAAAAGPAVTSGPAVETGPGPVPAALAVLCGQTARVVVTQGPAGCWYGEPGAVPVHVSAPVVAAVDTTGAGDAFVAALAVAWGEHRPVLDAIRWASAAGAGAATRLGASTGLPSRAAIDALYRDAYPG